MINKNVIGATLISAIVVMAFVLVVKGMFIENKDIKSDFEIERKESQRLEYNKDIGLSIAEEGDEEKTNDKIVGELGKDIKEEEYITGKEIEKVEYIKKEIEVDAVTNATEEISEFDLGSGREGQVIAEVEYKEDIINREEELEEKELYEKDKQYIIGKVRKYIDTEVLGNGYLSLIEKESVFDVNTRIGIAKESLIDLNYYDKSMKSGFNEDKEVFELWVDVMREVRKYEKLLSEIDNEVGLNNKREKLEKLRLLEVGREFLDKTKHLVLE